MIFIKIKLLEIQGEFDQHTLILEILFHLPLVEWTKTKLKCTHNTNPEKREYLSFAHTHETLPKITHILTHKASKCLKLQKVEIEKHKAIKPGMNNIIWKVL